MSETMRVGETDYPLSQRASEWKEIIDEVTILAFDLVALFEKAKDLYERAANKAGSCCCTPRQTPAEEAEE